MEAKLFCIVLLFVAVFLIPYVRAEAAKRRAPKQEPVIVDTHTVKGWRSLR